MVKYASSSPMEEFYSIKAFKFKDNLPNNVDTTVVFVQVCFSVSSYNVKLSGVEIIIVISFVPNRGTEAIFCLFELAVIQAECLKNI